MEFAELLKLLGDEAVFRSSFLLSGQHAAAGLRRQLDRWVKAGRVVMLRRGVYMLAAPHIRRRPHPFAIANALRSASYVSLQSALEYHGWIPEHVPVVTSVTTNRPETITTPVGRFAFRHVKRSAFRGFRHTEVAPGQTVRMATPEKALVDLLYLTPGSDAPEFLEELRVLPPPVAIRAELERAAAGSTSGKVMRATRRLLALWKRQGSEVVL